MKTNVIYFLIVSFLLLISFNSCKKEEAVDMTDQELYNMAKVTDGFVWYKNSDALLDKSVGSGHDQPFLRTRYNTVAATKLNVEGKVSEGITFPEGSLIVKELYDDPSTLAIYAVLYKNPGHKNADSDGWVWAYLEANGNVLESSSNKGGMCFVCHTQVNNIDHTLMNTFFP